MSTSHPLLSLFPGITHFRKKSKSPLQIRGHGFLFVGAFAQAEQFGAGTDWFNLFCVVPDNETN